MKLCQYIDTTIGLGKFQITTFIVLCLVGTQDGVEMILSTFLNTIIKAFYPQLTSAMIQLLASLFFIGIIFGTIISSHLSDKYGRKQMVNYGSILQIIIGVLFYFSNSIPSLFILRFLYGFGFGFTNSITTTLLVQIMPTKYRGKSLILFSLCITFGKMYALLLGHLFIKDNLLQTDWKTMMFLGGAPSALALIGSLIFIQQSPRFLLSKHRFEEAFIVLDKIAISNNVTEFQKLTESDKQDIINQFSNFVSIPDQTSYIALFQYQNLKKTLSLSVIWIFINLCFYGQLTVEALHIINKNTDLVNLKNYILTVSGEIPSFIISLLMIDQPLFGRKNSILIFFLSGSFFHLLFGISSLQVMSSIARFFMKDVFQIIDPLTTESYDTSIRSKGYGFCAGLSRIGAVIMPYIVFPLNQLNPGSVYYLFSFVMFLAGLIVWSSIEQTMNKCLENVDDITFNHEENDPEISAK